MSYIYAEKASWEPESPLPHGNEECPYCGKDVLIREQSEDGPLDNYEKCECPWCLREFEVTVEYEPVFYAHEPHERD